MKVGITGSRGVLGKILLRKLSAVAEIDCFPGDIRKKEDILEWLEGKSFDAIFHLAAIVPVNQVNDDPFEAYKINVGGTLNLLDSLKEKRIKPWIFYSSSSHVYKSSVKPLNENDQIKPLNIYGESKYFAERICEGFRTSHDYKVCIGRIFSFYHDTQKSSFLYPAIKRRLRSEDLSKPFFLMGAKNIRDIQNAETVVDHMIKLMNVGYDGTVNIGSGKETTIEGFVKSLSEKELKIESNPEEITSFLVADTTKLNQVLNT